MQRTFTFTLLLEAVSICLLYGINKENSLPLDFALSTHMKALGLKLFAALTSTSVAKEVRDSFPVKGGSRGAAWPQITSCMPVLLRDWLLPSALPSLFPEHLEEICSSQLF